MTAYRPPNLANTLFVSALAYLGGGERTANSVNPGGVRPIESSFVSPDPSSVLSRVRRARRSTPRGLGSSSPLVGSCVSPRTSAMIRYPGMTVLPGPEAIRMTLLK